MTCKDCIHYDVCSKLCTGIDMNLFMKDDNTTASESCTDFKDKTKYIDLPCKVGDEVYRINDDNQLDELKVEYGYIDKDGAIRFRATCAHFIECNGGFEDEEGIPCIMPNEVCSCIYNASEVGRSIFATKKEAEKALKARERE